MAEQPSFFNFSEANEESLEPLEAAPQADTILPAQRAVFIAVRFSDINRSYLVLGTYLTKIEAETRMYQCCSDLKPTNVSNSYYCNGGVCWVKRLLIGDNTNLQNFINVPDPLW